MNGHPPNPTITSFTIQDMLQMRMALDTIKQPSEKINDSITHLDECIHQIITALSPQIVRPN